MRNDQYLSNSLIDRLCSDNVDVKHALLRDLRNLLNTKLVDEVQSEYTELTNSLLNYGLHEFSQIEVAKNKVADFIKQKLAQTLQQHEPRLKNIIITPHKVDKQTINFNITATLLNEPDSIEIQFDSSYHPNIQQFDVSERD